jgi:D-alanine-D-alanine ligase
VYTPREQTPNREYISEQQVALTRRALRSRGYAVTVAQFHPRTIQRVIARADVILNLAYGWISPRGKNTLLQADVAGLLEKCDVPLVGASSEAQRIAQDKFQTGEIVRATGILTPRNIDLAKSNGRLPARAVLKPRFGACGRGVRLVDPRQLRRFNSRTSILQEYVDGEEYTVGVICRRGKLQVLPPIAVRFDSAPAVKNWTHFRWSHRVCENRHLQFVRVAELLFSTLQLRDYGRFDLRLTQKGPVLLDANALPNLDPTESMLPMAARAAGIDYAALLKILVDSALLRGGRKP